MLYIKYDLSAVSVKRELGYPKDSRTLKSWYKNYLVSGTTGINKIHHKYTDEQRRIAVQHYIDHGRCLSRTVRKLGYPSNPLLLQWIKEDHPEEFEKRRLRRSNSMLYLDQSQKEQAVIDLMTREGTADEVAEKHGVKRSDLYNWSRQMLGRRYKSMSKCKPPSDKPIEQSTNELIARNNQLAKENAELEKQNYLLRMENDALRMTSEILKKGQGVSPTKLTNREKTVVIGALRKDYPLKELLMLFGMAKSSYCYQQAALKVGDKYADLRVKVQNIFNTACGRYGYRRIYLSLKNEGIRVSEKVVRRLMHNAGLNVYRIRKRRYSSYKGEITPAAPNLLNRNFHADKPNIKWLTDITEFSIPAGKAYLSPVIDCFDGLPVSWTIGTSPNAELVNTMLDEAISKLSNNEHPIIHSDRGWHYRGPGWISRMDSAGLIRSMSKKGCSADNSACEGFFGRLKNEMFYCRSWINVSIEQFIDQVNEYMHWYAEDRIKASLGGLSPLQYRRMLGLAN